MIAARGGEHTEFLVRASYLEIYNEDVRPNPNPAGVALSARLLLRG